MLFLLLCIVIHAAVFHADIPNAYDALHQDSRFTLFLAEINKYEELVSILKSETGYRTVLAPTNDAMKGLQVSLETLLYHISALAIPELTPMIIPSMLQLSSLNYHYQMIKVISFENFIYVGSDSSKSKVLEHRVSFHSGFVYPIDRLLKLPTDIKTELIFISGTSSVSTFLAALEYTNLTKIIRNMSAITVLAPNNKAFEELGPRMLRFLFSPVGKLILRTILKYHIAIGEQSPLYSNQIANDDIIYLKTILKGRNVSFQKKMTDSGDVLVINRSSIATKRNILSRDGVAHVIDKVLLPFFRI